ncbi:MAG: tRNA (N(6)-L-threonylcarbamoyladenosine(37)-C(2))-methylthiotransferase MtaB [Parvularculaceae bacterium]|nr:tRNA (N(6)-L-threonylcarbamoyladenosine(37)-C(2))-methylthiotransferase MtaB [Parvularculaceae bacterium]
MSIDVVSLGCRLNAFEGEAMKRLAREAGLGRAVIVNSCAVTAEAVRQTRQTIRRARREQPEARIVVTGCAAQIDAAAFAAMPEVDAVVGNDEKLIGARWRSLAKGGERILVNDVMSVRSTAPQLVEAYGDRARAFLQIQNGCDHRCTFCIIPYGRGPSRSVPVGDVVTAARRLVDEGHAEIVLTGVDITSYGADLEGAPTLGMLVERLLIAAPKLVRLRLSSVDGAEMDPRLVDLIASETRLAPHLHLSLQSGDDMILKRMKRRHRRTEAISFCRNLRARRPDIAFGADLIAGFPTETDEMFGRSVLLIEEAGLNFVHVFPYSPRPGTPAARMPQLDRAIVKSRAARLREAASAALVRFLDDQIGKRADAVIETGGRIRLPNFAVGKLSAPSGAPGAVIRVEILARRGDELVAAPVHAKEAA